MTPCQNRTSDLDSILRPTCPSVGFAQRYTDTEVRRQQILGLYRRASWRFPGRREEARKETLELIAIDGQLYTQVDGGERRQLLPVSDSLFRRLRDNRATLFVGSDAGGEIHFQEDSDNFSKIDP